jgi:hypothetical protein
VIVCRSTAEGRSWVDAVGLDAERCAYVPTESLDGSVILAGARPAAGDEVHYAPSAARGRHAEAVAQALMVAGWPAPEVIR